MATYIIDGDKGGVGKSFVARAFADYLINSKSSGEVVVFDCDPTTRDVVGNSGFDEKEIVGNVTVNGISAPIDSQEDWFNTIDVASKLVTAEVDFVFSLPAGAGLLIDDTVLSLFDLITPVTTVWVMGRDQSSVDQLHERVRRAPKFYERGLVALNEFHGSVEKGAFDLWQRDDIRGEIVREDGWREFRVPILNVFVTKTIKNMPLHRAVELSISGRTSPTIRVGIEAFRRALRAEILRAAGD